MLTAALPSCRYGCKVSAECRQTAAGHGAVLSNVTMLSPAAHVTLYDSQLASRSPAQRSPPSRATSSTIAGKSAA